jgi:hypothetical protein
VRRGNWAQVEEATRNYKEAEGPKKQKRKKNKRKKKMQEALKKDFMAYDLSRKHQTRL